MLGKTGKKVAIIKDGKSTGLFFPDDSEYWIQRVIENHIMWDKYGAGFDTRTLPLREYQSHLALITGQRLREIAEQNKKPKK